MRPIDADTLLDGLDENCGDLDLQYNSEYAKLVHYIDSQPTLDYEPVRHGDWDDKIVPFCNVCSVCKVFVDRGCFPTVRHKGCLVPNIGELKYCPNCGAKMDGGKNDA